MSRPTDHRNLDLCDLNLDVAFGRAGGKVGGKRRAMSLTPERRREIAAKAAAARWANHQVRVRFTISTPEIGPGSGSSSAGSLPPQPASSRQ